MDETLPIEGFRMSFFNLSKKSPPKVGGLYRESLLTL